MERCLILLLLAFLGSGIARAVSASDLEFVRDRSRDPSFGPGFNDTSCANCHFRGIGQNTIGGPGPNYRSNVWAVVPGQAPQLVPLFRLGGGGGELPEGTTEVSFRIPPQVFGLARVERIPDEEILRLADPDDRDGDGISGRPAWDGARVARFGWQPRHARLVDFVVDAFHGEFGITRDELLAHHRYDLIEIMKFLQGLPDPRPGPSQPPAVVLERGRQLFDELGCADCHVPEVAGVRAYSDFLLHDMGWELDEGVALGTATSSEYRTAPLWGFEARGVFLLHNGKGGLLDHTLLLHGGEGAAARAGYQSLTVTDKNAVLQFLTTL
jgi:CxxC motif-containing protein (DUF1111 family)